MKEKSIVSYQAVNIILFLAMIVVNALANILPLNGQETGAISDSYPNLFVPAGITFAVWGVIYVLLALFILYQTGIFTRKSNTHPAVVENVGWWFALSSLANVAWIFFWHYNLIHLSLIAMLVILLSLIVIHLKYAAVSEDKQETWFFKVPFSVYFGWITVATIANVTAVLVNDGWDGFGLPGSLWTVIMIAVAAIITLMVTVIRRDLAYPLVIIWAFTGIIIKHTTVFNMQYSGVVWTAGICIAVVVLGMAVAIWKRRKKSGADA